VTFTIEGIIYSLNVATKIQNIVGFTVPFPLKNRHTKCQNKVNKTSEKEREKVHD
jgi:hypothetical protein